MRVVSPLSEGGMTMNLAETYLGQQVLQRVAGMVLRNPEENLPRLVDLAIRIAPLESHREIARKVKPFLDDKDGNWYKLGMRMLTETHPKVRERTAVNFFINASFLGIPKQREAEKRLGVKVPWAILMDPTEKCNLRCIGCWAGDYQLRHELSLETMDRVCREGGELGIHFYVISGGEPMVRKNDLLELARRHPEQMFHIYTNGTLITEEFAREAAERGNMVFALSIEGLEETTDARRGKGVFQKVMRAMDILHDAGLIYGFSATYTRKNTEEVASDEFIDLMVDKGCAFGWYFTYIPIGRDVDLELMATPEQRAYMFDRIREFRRTKPIFLVDFWNDGEAAVGCIAGGRKYFHINAAGEVEPCAFAHYATCNINDVSVEEALQNPLFKAYQKRQPFDPNLRRPCPIIDHPEMLRDMVHESGAYPTQLTANETVDEFAAKLASYATAWGELADKIWKDEHGEGPVAVGLDGLGSTSR